MKKSLLVLASSCLLSASALAYETQPLGTYPTQVKAPEAANTNEAKPTVDTKNVSNIAVPQHNTMATTAPAATPHGACLKGGVDGTLVPGVNNLQGCSAKGKGFNWVTASTPKQHMGKTHSWTKEKSLASADTKHKNKHKHKTTAKTAAVTKGKAKHKTHHTTTANKTTKKNQTQM